MTRIRLVVAVLAAVALAATLALLAVAAPAASQQHAGAAVYCPDKPSRKHDLAVANAALRRAKANVGAKTKALGKAKRTGKGIAKAQKALALAKARLADAKAAQHDAAAAYAECD